MNRPRLAVDLNADLGEGFPWDEAMLDRVTSASIGCGVHAGNLNTTLQAITWASARGVAIGAHPGYDDRDSFGRREQKLTPSEVASLIVEQVEEVIDRSGVSASRFSYLKPHGALYNQAQVEVGIARGVVDACLELRLGLFGQSSTILAELAAQSRVPLYREGFADRRYLPDGRLAPRWAPDSILTDPIEIAEQIRRLAKSGVQTICLHGDEHDCVERADQLRQVLDAMRIEVRPLFPGRPGDGS